MVDMDAEVVVKWVRLDAEMRRKWVAERGLKLMRLVAEMGANTCRFTGLKCQDRKLLEKHGHGIVATYIKQQQASWKSLWCHSIINMDATVFVREVVQVLEISLFDISNGVTEPLDSRSSMEAKEDHQSFTMGSTGIQLQGILGIWRADQGAEKSEVEPLAQSTTVRRELFKDIEETPFAPDAKKPKHE
ncbi:hypothetical protein CTI12_AA026190 [Artemisia annua]|uniref:Uncharacterized protein n=1 Tax=Artemisia annua TaxID=35608 RepID=A0A2U1QIH3_ARTAN|nr:hypothetical protein CTI12_AA026190 [Artemisia annua]